MVMQPYAINRKEFAGVVRNMLGRLESELIHDSNYVFDLTDSIRWYYLDIVEKLEDLEEGYVEANILNGDGRHDRYFV